MALNTSPSQTQTNHFELVFHNNINFSGSVIEVPRGMKNTVCVSAPWTAHGSTGRLTAENVYWEAVTASGGGSNMLTVAGCPLWAVIHFPVTWGSLWLDLKIRSRNKATDFSQLSDRRFFFFHFYILCVVGFCGIFKEAFLKEDKVQKQVRKLELF